MSFASPAVLVALLAVPLAVAVYVVWNLSARATPTASRIRRCSRTWSTAARAGGATSPIALLLVGLTALLVGAARPRALVDVKRENATVVLAIDTSRSMQAIDVRPSRLDAIKLAALKFVDRTARRSTASASSTSPPRRASSRRRPVIASSSRRRSRN